MSYVKGFIIIFKSIVKFSLFLVNLDVAFDDRLFLHVNYALIVSYICYVKFSN